MAPGARVRVAREEHAHIRRLTRQVTALQRELHFLVKVVGAASGHAGIVKASCVEGAGGARF